MPMFQTPGNYPLESIQHSEPITHSAVCLTTGPQLLPKRDLHNVRSGAFSFKSQHNLFSLTSSNSCLRHIPHISRESNSHSPLFWETDSFIHSVFCLTTGPKPPPKRFLHIDNVQNTAKV